MKDLKRNRRLNAAMLVASILVLWAGERSGAAQTQSVDKESAEKKAATDQDVPPPLTNYLGRRIARTMHYFGAEWLIRENREDEEHCSLMLTKLGVKPGMIVCDMGCGNGFYALKMAKMVGDQGGVICVDIQPEMLEFLKKRAMKLNVTNYRPVLGKIHDPRLPVGKVDLILCVDVYHEFSHPEQMLAGMRASLAPGGKVVLLEYREEDPKVPIKPLHKMSKAQVMKEMTANGFKLVEEFNRLPWQHMMFFGRDDDKTLNAIEPVEWRRDG